MNKARTKGLTRTQRWVLDFLKAEAEKDPEAWVSPTTIGRHYGYYASNNGISKTPFATYHSSWASPRCLQLVGLDLIERNEHGHYRYKQENKQ